MTGLHGVVVGVFFSPVLTAQLHALPPLITLSAFLPFDSELPINIECFMEDKDVSARVKREDFESICTDLFQRVNRFHGFIYPDYSFVSGSY